MENNGSIIGYIAGMIRADFILFLLLMILIAILIAKIAGLPIYIPAITDNNHKSGGNIKHKYREKDLNKFKRSKSEEYVIAILEKETGHKFPTVYPDWLKYKKPNGKITLLELDGYCDELKIAIEFSGPQHTKWYKTEEYETYYDRLCRDQTKIKLCADNGVKLMLIDYTMPRTQLINYIRSRLYDFEICPEPYPYIPEQSMKPYRNHVLESDLDWKCELLPEHIPDI